MYVCMFMLVLYMFMCYGRCVMEFIKFGRRNNMYYCFSNYYPCTIEYEGLTYNSVEAAFQAAKTLSRDERVLFTKMSPSFAKRNGRKLNLRPDWEEVKLSIMKELIVAKSKSCPEFTRQLVSTKGKGIIEDTTGWHDNIWGSCSCEKCKHKWKHNNLGKILMEVRDEILSKFDLL